MTNDRSGHRDAVAPDPTRFHVALATLPRRQTRFDRLLRQVIGAGCRLVRWRLEVRRSPLPRGEGLPGGGCVVVAAPHRAWVEPFLVHAGWPAHAAKLVWLADERTVTRSWWRRRLLPRIGVLPVGRASGGPRSYARLAAEALSAGRAVVVFPEVGPPSPPARPRRISPGFAYLALAAGAPVVPVVIGGTHRIVRGSHFSLDVLDPIEVGPAVSDPFTPEARRRAHELARRYEAAVAAVLPERTAEADAHAPATERWRWLGRLLG